jgi:hypothetical protein
MADETEVQSSTEETTETTEAQETETTEERESSGAEGAEETKDYRKIAEDQRKRAEKAEAELKKLKPKPAQEALSGDHQRLDRIELNSLGIQNRDDQDLVIGAAKRMGVSLTEAAADEYVSAKLERQREARKTKDATPAPGRGTGSSTANVTKLAEKALQTGELPTDPALKAKVKAEMRRVSSGK